MNDKETPTLSILERAFLALDARDIPDAVRDRMNPAARELLRILEAGEDATQGAKRGTKRREKPRNPRRA